MRFEHHPRAEEQMRSHGMHEFRAFKCETKVGQFVIVYNTKVDYWSASYRMPGRDTTIHIESPDKVQTHMGTFYTWPTQLAAERACEAIFKIIRNPN